MEAIQVRDEPEDEERAKTPANAGGSERRDGVGGHDVARAGARATAVKESRYCVKLCCTMLHIISRWHYPNVRDTIGHAAAGSNHEIPTAYRPTQLNYRVDFHMLHSACSSGLAFHMYILQAWTLVIVHARLLRRSVCAPPDQVHGYIQYHILPTSSFLGSHPQTSLAP